ncbi:electron transfer flavoprotein-ubiquinone oxidoreductase [Eionea flava]
MEREVMEYDVCIVGAGPAGLSAAIKLRQLAVEHNIELSVCVLEKGSEVGAHILSGAIFEPRALHELIPDWQQQGAPLSVKVTRDEVFLFPNGRHYTEIPTLFVPKTLHNDNNYIVSLGNVCRWLAEQAEALEVDVITGFAASTILYDEENRVVGVTTGDMGLDDQGKQKESFEPGMAIHAKYTIFSEGCRGHLGKELMSRYQLDEDSDPQHYGLGIKELWTIDPNKHRPGLVVHGAGWPLNRHGTTGGFFLYHGENHQVVVGLITDLNYSNPHISPYDEFQQLKHHPEIARILEGGERISYGARAIAKGGFYSLPKMTFAGGLLVGCDAGTLNVAKIKGSHTAMKSGMLAAETIVDALRTGDQGGTELVDYAQKFKASWLYDELHNTRNFGGALHKLGTRVGGAYNFIDQNIFRGRLPFTFREKTPDHAQLKSAKKTKPIVYPKPDGVLSFDRLSSVFLSNTNHEEDQPCHLQLRDNSIPVQHNLAIYDAPEQRYCPAGVYEMVEDTTIDSASKTSEGAAMRLQINAQNCIHCKTCDIKDPSQNITWVTPEGSGGPNYPNM